MDDLKRHIILLIMTITPIITYAQLSPGDLTTAHEHLEGLKNCTECHDLGNKVPDSKCLDCHSEIQTLLDQNRGFHAFEAVAEQNCTVCHNEHHGRKFEMIRFDENTFDHSMTGYDLDGEHGIQECRACHKSEFIKDEDLRHRENTFLGLDQECLTCHDDFHQGTLNNDCALCHSFDAFRPAPYFNHDDSNFALKGAHNDVECKECHPIELRNGVEFQVFTGLEFSRCTDCHQDPHNYNFQSRCTDCHNENSWANFVGDNRFDHDRTSFELKGSHIGLDCFSCHDADLAVANIFSDLSAVDQNDCLSCHEDVHEGKFGNDCVSCHNEESFFLLNDMDLFDHNLTDYPLEGLHLEVDCKACHLTERYTDDMPYANCFDCHEDYHNGDFTENGIQRDCDECHTLENDFIFTSYGLLEHQESDFPLEGAHIATPCFECHLSEDQWEFKSIGHSCVDCHDDIHEGFISDNFYPDQDCTKCHSSESWAAISFDHSLTDWALVGEHNNVACAECHIEKDTEGNLVSQEFINLSTTCFDCHDNPHGNQFEEEGITDCAKCHTSNNWSPDLFDHSLTEFPLDGKHAEVECRACHNETTVVDGEERIIYQMESFECIDCHL